MIQSSLPKSRDSKMKPREQRRSRCRRRRALLKLPIMNNETAFLIWFIQT